MPAHRDEFRFFHRLRVRWAEVDMQKIVFNAHYLMYFDTAITDYWRALAMPYAEGMALLHGDLYVVKATVEFHASAHMDDRVDVALRCEHIGQSSMRFKGAIFRGEDHLISAELVYVFADPATQTSRPVPDVLRAMLMAYEAGEVVLDVRVGTWAELRDGARALRDQVFVQEQRMPPAVVSDDADAQALHLVAFNRLGQPVATGRLSTTTPGVAKIDKIVVMRGVRGSGIGRTVLRQLMQAARERGDTMVVVDAARSCVDFYQKEGFSVCKSTFSERGTVYQPLTAAL